MSTPTPGYLTRREGTHFVLEALNHKAQGLTKLPASMIGRPLDPLYADQPEAMAAAETAFREQRTIARDLRVRRADLAVANQTLRLTFVPMPPAHLVVYSEDVTEPSDLARGLADAEARNASIVAAMMEGVLLLDTQGLTLLGNAAAAKLLGVREADLLRRAPEDIRAWRVDDAPAAPGDLPWRRALATGEGVSAVRLTLDVDGARRAVLASARPIRDPTRGELTSVACTLTDVTALEESSAALRESELAFHRSERWLDAALEAGQLGVFEWSSDDNRGTWSPHLEALFGVQTEPGVAGYLELVHPEDRPRIAEIAMATLGQPGASFDTHYRVVRPDGEVRWVRTTGRYVEYDGRMRLLGVMADMSERYRMQEALARAERLESLGRLAGGVAHDFNNLLTVILTSVGLAQAGASSEVQRELATVQYAAERARELTGQLLAFARRQVVEISVVDLDALLRRTEQMLRRLVGDEIELRTEDVRSGAHVRVDAAQVEQVVVNLVANARDAMPQGGRIALATGVERVDEAAASALGVATGDYVVLEVEDSGAGIDPTVREKLFEPFFSTKDSGTGLGLASAYGIVRQLGGTIAVESEAGAGAVFRVYLPKVEPPREGAPRASAPRRATGRGESILLVDDDELVRATTARLLERLGYSVTATGDAESALAAAAAAPAPFALLLTDMSMPGMNGLELVQRMRERHPQTRALVVSGNPPPAETSDALAFLQKPYTLESLAARVRALLASAG
ncbi:MAG: PAS domain S-box protein [Myxococcales bacterium]|nr:PAS domain S-box protein [Myxococcales bacterium]